MSHQTSIYLSLSHEDYKGVELQMTEFKETTHTTETGFYHKSIRIKLNDETVMEFHGPIVKAAENPEQQQ